MSRRVTVGVLALALTLGLLFAVALVPLPYVTYRPGPTVDILGTVKGEEIIQVSGHEAYYDDGELRLTTIYVDTPQQHVALGELLRAWVSPEEAVYPRDAVYGPDETDETNDAESAVQMVSSQDAAVAAALTELGYDVEAETKVLHVDKSLPAAGKLKARDILLSVGETTITEPQDVVTAVDQAPVGEPLPFEIRRGEQILTVNVTPEEVDGDKRVGITPGPGFTFPFDVTVKLGDDIGGPSAGFMFSLAIYDTLTPGSLTDGQSIAGSGTIDAEGKTGPIGGVQQKIAGAEEAGAKLFFVAADNCDDVVGIQPSGMRLARADTLRDAIAAVEAWTADPDADLPSCEEQS